MTVGAMLPQDLRGTADLAIQKIRDGEFATEEEAVRLLRAAGNLLDMAIAGGDEPSAQFATLFPAELEMMRDGRLADLEAACSARFN